MTEFPPPPSYGYPVSADTSALRGATLQQAYQRFWQKYADFTGRASRSEYWYVLLANLIIVIGLEIVMAIVGNWFVAVIVLFGLAALVPGIAVAVRRLHDIGKSGWWYLIGLVPFVGFIILIVFLATAEKPEGDKYNVA